MEMPVLSHKINVNRRKINSWAIALLFIVPFILLNSSCSKKNDNPKNPKISGCDGISWYDALGDTGIFRGNYQNSKFDLSNTYTSKNGNLVYNISFDYDPNHHIINDNPGYVVTYNNDNIVEINYTDSTTTWVMNFDSLGQLTTINANGTDNGSTTDASYTYTYDKNGDPVNINIQYSSTSLQGTDNWVYNITGSYWTNTKNFLPDEPELAPFTVNFAYCTYISRHLIDTWVIHATGALADGTNPVIEVTRSYNYTFDKSGYVSTMVQLDNPNNIYTFQFSQCQ